MRLHFERVLFLCVAFAAGVSLLFAQPTAKGPDILVFTNGDQLRGKFVSSSGASVKFKSDVLGDITVDWKKVKELHTASKVAVIRKGVKLDKHSDTSTIPQGALSVENQDVHLTAPPAPPQSIPVGEAATIIDQPSFHKAVTESPGFFHDWNGAVTLGASLIEATQNNQTVTGAISLVRGEPAESWLTLRNRTLFDFSAAFGEISQPNTPTVKTSIYHADAERDEYFVDHVFGFAQAAFDHNFSQGLNLQQAYGGGIGMTVIQRPNETLDVKGSLSYLHQDFQTPPNQDLIGSIFGEHYKRGLKRGVVIDQLFTITPTWNILRAYSAFYSTLVTMPVYKHLNASTGIIDTFLNDPPPGFKKNSFQFTLGFTYKLR
jgi:hypothetical protein